MIHILTDSTSDLNQELIDQFGIGLIPLSVFIDNKTFKDQIEIDSKALFTLVEKTGNLPKTSAPSVAEFIQFLDLKGDVVFIGISDKLSATVNNALLARENLPNRQIRIINSLNLSSGIGLMVTRAAELRDNGATVQQIEAQVTQLIPKIRTSFVIDTLDYLYKGGRCSAMSMIMGSLLKIRPMIQVQSDGTLGVKEKITGSRRKALNSMITDFQNHFHQIDPHRVFVTHTGCHQDAEFLAEEIKKVIPIENINICTAGATIASHCGPNTIGVIYATK